MEQVPPQDIAPDELWRRITERPRPHRVIDLPQKDAGGKAVGRVAMVVLTQTEQQAVIAASDRWVRKFIASEKTGTMDRSEAYETLYSSRAAVETLSRAMRRDTDPTRPAFMGSDVPGLLSNHFLPDEIAVLMKEYLHTRATLGPIVSTMSDDEYALWKERLKAGALLYPLAYLTSGLTSELLLRLGADLMRSQTDKP
jgi:hypothetical protein